MTNKTQFWNRRTYCVITGASQGIGRQIAIDFAKQVADQSAFFLLARNVDNLNETKRLVTEANPNVDVFVHSVNLGEPIGVELYKLLSLSLTVFKTEPHDYELTLIVHNAGTLGDISELSVEMRNTEKLTNYLTLNLHSAILLTTEFLKVFAVDKDKTETAIVNITSLCAVEPFVSMAYYCIGKAAREMYFKVLSKENPDLTVLNYSPGPVMTDMVDEIIETVRLDEMKNIYVEMKRDSKLLTTQQTVGKLVEILGGRSYVNGGRKDYYDD